MGTAYRPDRKAEMLITDIFRPTIFFSPDDEGGGEGDAATGDQTTDGDLATTVTAAGDTQAQPDAKATDQGKETADYDPARDEEVARLKGVLAQQQARLKAYEAPADQPAKNADQVSNGDILKSPLLKGLKVHKQTDNDGEVTGHLVEFEGEMLSPEVVLRLRRAEQFESEVRDQFDSLKRDGRQSERQKVAKEQFDTAISLTGHIVTKSLPDLDPKLVKTIGVGVARALAADDTEITDPGELAMKYGPIAAQAVRKLVAAGVEAHLKTQQRPGGNRISPSGPPGKPGRKSAWDASPQELERAAARQA
jgi:hypothetical protein